MIRGTTAQFKFKIPYSKSDLVWVAIKFWQPNNPSTFLPIIRNLENCAAQDDSNELHVSLTASETAVFVDKYKAKVQLRGQTTGGTVFGCAPKLITVYPMLDSAFDGVPEFPSGEAEDWVILDGKEVVT